MQPRDFDQLIIRKWEEQDVPFDTTSGWEKVSAQLPRRRQKRNIWLLGSGMAAALLVGFVLYAKRNTPTKEQAGQKTWTQNAETSFPSLQESHSPKNRDQQSLVGFVKNNIVPPSETKDNPSPGVPIRQEMLQQPTVDAHFIAPPRVQWEDLRVVSHTATSQSGASQTELILPTNAAINFSPTRSANRGVKNMISIIGGMNYGSLSPGFTAGVSAKRNLGGKWSVESSLSMINNSSAQVISGQELLRLRQPGGLSKGMSVAHEEANFLYVQFNPQINYQLLRPLSVGLGVDFQKLLNGHDVFLHEDQELRAVPNMDMGLTAKAEVSISRQLQAGILYREGLSELGTGLDVEAMQRSYFQVQLKWVLVHR